MPTRQHSLTTASAPTPTPTPTPTPALITYPCSFSYSCFLFFDDEEYFRRSTAKLQPTHGTLKPQTKKCPSRLRSVKLQPGNPVCIRAFSNHARVGTTKRPKSPPTLFRLASAPTCATRERACSQNGSASSWQSLRSARAAPTTPEDSAWTNQT